MSEDTPDTASRTIRITAVAVAATGVCAQMLQRVDPTFFLLYFTVQSALLCGLGQAVLVLRGRSAGWEAPRDAACTAPLVSAVVYLAVVLPHRPLSPSDGALVWVATVCLHGLLPVLAVADFLRSGRQRTPRTRGADVSSCSSLWGLLSPDVAGSGQGARFSGGPRGPIGRTFRGAMSAGRDGTAAE
ncbi:hypothetical protein [Nocardiopsis sp. LOL_012]|uniref:hypothetical protein n=1 Tax=Nocardiopsis sp. LOL_012 TaxID=3345409 RepID=UPI003A8379B8